MASTARRIDINADLGEGYGTDEALLAIVSSANIACGFHAGDAQTMRAVSLIAAQNKVAVGAHPSFDDLGNFGRTVMKMSMDELESLIAYQIGVLTEAAAESGVALTHVKPHGALYNVASEDEAHALAIGRAIRAADPKLIYLGFTGPVMRRAADKLGLAFASEAFPDRHYTDDGQLTPRPEPLSVINNPVEVTERVKRMMQDGMVPSASGKLIPIEFDSLCVHGDEPTAVMVGRAVRRAVEDAGAVVAPLSEILGGASAHSRISA
ncbi:LamB/YcsF family protein [Terrihabitans soli]|nr:5-oxoprolinase subunit PxpA [Terrihabitans soli]